MINDLINGPDYLLIPDDKPKNNFDKDKYFKLRNNRSLTILIPDGESNNALAIIRCLGQEKNINVVVLSNIKNNSLKYSRYVHQYIYKEDVFSEEGKISRLINAIIKLKADVLMPIDIDTIRLVSKFKSELSGIVITVPVPNLDEFEIANNKWLLSVWLKKNKIACPKTIFLESDKNFNDALGDFSFPFLVKPTIGFGGNGIEIIHNKDQFKSWFLGFDSSRNFIVQSYINGFDIDVNVICVNGEVLVNTIQKSIKHTKDDEWSYAVKFFTDESIVSFVKNIAKKLNWTGILNIGLRYDLDTKDVKVIEMNPRFWASVSAPLFVGVNFPYLLFLTAIDKKISITKYNETIVMRTKPAFQMILKKFTFRPYQKFDHSYFELNIKDPLPSIVKLIYRFVK